MSNIPARINGKTNPAYTKNWKKNNPLKVRELNRKTSKKWRDEHGDEWKEYFRNYMRVWTQKNKEIHSLRQLVSNIKTALKRGFEMRSRNQEIYRRMLEVGWSAEDDTKCINHKVSLKLLLECNKNIPPLVAFDILNLEFIDRKENNSASKREVTRNTIMIARELETKYPKELVGLTAIVESKLGKII
jgi:DNA-binding SARP family transcriptional activator